MLLKRVAWLPVLLLLALFALALYRTAWLSDDAYITYRTIDNFLHGYGLRWNIVERVQPYTHPLWMLLNLAVIGVTREFFFTGIYVCIVISFVTACVVAFVVAPSRRHAVAALTLLLFSRAFMDFNTSGLENCLTHLLLALFFVIYARDQWSARTLLLLSLVAGLATLNRMDAILVYLPALGYVWLSMRSLKGIGAVAAGFLPVVAWEVFSLVYYGMLFPNTAYAKLGTGIPTSELIHQGWLYYLHTLVNDPITLPVIAAGLVCPLFFEDKRYTPFIAGLFLYLFYVLKIGGDFMAGRFFALPFFLAVLLLMHARRLKQPLVFVSVLACAAIMSGLLPDAPPFSGADCGSVRPHTEAGIMNERAFYFPGSSLLAWKPGKEMPDEFMANDGRKLNKLQQPVVRVKGSMGYRGFFGGPLVHLVDQNALTDPLLARLPAKFNMNWRIGHFGREIPKGYIPTVTAQQNHIADRNLRELYDQLALVTQAPLFSPDRWKAILRLNTGQLDGLVDKDGWRFPNIHKTTLEQHNAAAAAARNRGVTLLPGGMEVQLAELSHGARVQISLLSSIRCRVLFMRETTEWGYRDIVPPRDEHGWVTYAVNVPALARKGGYTAIRLMSEGDAQIGVGEVTLVE